MLIRRTNQIIFSILLLLFIFSNVNAEEKTKITDLRIGFIGGLSTPNDNINDIYNTNFHNWDEGLSNFLREGVKLGYHIGMKARLSLNEHYDFTGGLVWHKFPETRIDVKHPDKDSVIQTLYTSQNVFSIGVGLNIHLFEWFMSLYGTGDLQFNYLSSGVDFKYGDMILPLNLSSSPSHSRVGIGFGLGMDFDLSLLLLNLEIKYNITNVIGQDDNENIKSFLSLSAGVYF